MGVTGMSDIKDITVFALETLLEYAKYLEDNNHLTYQLLADRVETYKVIDRPEKVEEL